MSKTKVTPAMIVERFLLNSTSRYEEWVCGNNGIGCVSPESFITYHFQEALENLLMEQKLIICDEARAATFFGASIVDSESIINATSPLEVLWVNQKS